jgi:6-phosphogluconolactonase/glucosamine-6-phosphate isomerase/deaminase
MDYIYTKDPTNLASAHVARRIRELLSQNKKVLWIIAGGSSADIAIEVDEQLAGLNMSLLYVCLSDERFGSPGHKDENWGYLLKNGLRLRGANTYRILGGDSLESTTLAFRNWLDQTIDSVDYTLAIFGIGSDGHTAGIKAGSGVAESNESVESYKADDFERITITPKLIARVDEAIVQASGASKRATLRDWVANNYSIAEQPAQSLKQIEKLTIFTDIPKEE